MRSLIKKIANRTITQNDDDWGMNVNKWDWAPGVGMYGISRAYQTTGEEDIGVFIRDWIDKHIEHAYKVIVVNSIAPMLTVLEWYEHCGDEKYLKVCKDIAEWVINDAPRTCDGALEHTVTEDVDFGDQAWADTLFMAVLFVAKLGKLLNVEKYKEFAVLQIKTHYELLQDKSNGLFFHAWDGVRRDHLSGVYWARANAWVIATAVEIFELFDEFDGRDKLIKDMLLHVESLEKYQNDDGGFNTVLDKDTCFESSATAGIAYAIKRGNRLGIIPDNYLKIYNKALNIVVDNINDKGELENVSGGTAVQSSVEAYNAIPVYPALYGQGLAILLLCEGEEYE